MTAIENWIERAFKRHNNWNPEPGLEAHMCVSNVSKVYKGRWGLDRFRQTCDDPKCIVEKQRGRITECKWEPHDCDGEISRKYLNGLFEGPMVTIFDNDNRERGIHSAKVTLNDGNDDIMLGVMRGICNAGVVHEPIERSCEKCSHPDRWHGELEAAVSIGALDEKFYLLANYAIDMHFDDREKRDRATLVGTLEGMLIRNCRKPGK